MEYKAFEVNVNSGVSTFASKVKKLFKVIVAIVLLSMTLMAFRYATSEDSRNDIDLAREFIAMQIYPEKIIKLETENQKLKEELVAANALVSKVSSLNEYHANKVAELEVALNNMKDEALDNVINKLRLAELEKTVDNALLPEPTVGKAFKAHVAEPVTSSAKTVGKAFETHVAEPVKSSTKAAYTTVKGWLK